MKELSISSIHSGPLPSPEVMVGYKEVIPDGPERILKMTEKQSEHRMKMESRGQLFALIIAILGILSAVITGIWGSPWVGVAIGGGTLAILVVAFLKGSFGRG